MTAPAPHRLSTRGARIARWLLVSIGGFLVTQIIGGILLWAGLTYHWVQSWDALPAALLVLAAVSLSGGTLVAGLVARLRGWREWTLGLVLVAFVEVAPGLVISLLSNLRAS